MARKVAEKLMLCKKCGRETIHFKNVKEMNWIMHLVLAIFTAGLWLIVWFFILIWHIMTKPVGGKWTCSQCGLKS